MTLVQVSITFTKALLNVLCLQSNLRIKMPTVSWIEGTNESPDNIAFFLRLQQAYSSHTAIPTTKELKERNPEYIIWRALEKIEKKKGLARYYLREENDLSVPVEEVAQDPIDF